LGLLGLVRVMRELWRVFVDNVHRRWRERYEDPPVLPGLAGLVKLRRLEQITPPPPRWRKF
jgi:hypothetical protein